ncbi:hypothetical protein PCI56_21900 [Plesiomonas shigelloides subsp. oncorhynchi]|nr:hypothetical protein [Plesiomonas shigelloides]
MCGFAGAYLSVAQNAGFGREMTAGQGYIALAAVIFGKWRPWPTLGACLLFGFLTALETRMQESRYRALAYCQPKSSRRCRMC